MLLLTVMRAMNLTPLSHCRTLASSAEAAASSCQSIRLHQSSEMYFKSVKATAHRDAGGEAGTAVPVPHVYFVTGSDRQQLPVRRPRRGAGVCWPTLQRLQTAARLPQQQRAARGDHQALRRLRCVDAGPPG